jgi:hypothetical protein
MRGLAAALRLVLRGLGAAAGITGDHGDDAREFWVRAEERTSETARAYDALGLAEYEAIEAFVKWKFD